MLFVDAWLLYRGARGEFLDMLSTEFFEKLAAELIDVSGNNTQEEEEKNKKERDEDRKDNKQGQ